MNEINEKYCTLENYKNCIFSSIVFGKLFLKNQNFFIKYFNKTIILITLLLSGSLIILPIGRIIPLVFINATIFLIYGFIFFETISIVLQLMSKLFSERLKNNIAFIKDSYLIYIIPLIVLVTINYFYFNYDKLLLNFSSYAGYIIINFFLFIGFLIKVAVFFANFFIYLLVLIAINYLLNFISKKIPRFPIGVLIKVNILIYVIFYIGVLANVIFHTIKFTNYRNLIYPLIVNLSFIIFFITILIFLRAYKNYKKATVDYYYNNYKNIDSKKWNKIFSIVVKNTNNIRKLIVSLLFIISAKFLIYFLI